MPLKWTPDEEATLLRCYALYGKSWKKVSEHLCFRTSKQCREHYVNYLNPSLRHDAWSPEEDDALRALHAQFGTKWCRIASALTTRSQLAIRYRLRVLDQRLTRDQGGNADRVDGPNVPVCEDAVDLFDDHIKRKRFQCMLVNTVGDRRREGEMILFHRSVMHPFGDPMRQRLHLTIPPAPVPSTPSPKRHKKASTFSPSSWWSMMSDDEATGYERVRKRFH